MKLRIYESQNLDLDTVVYMLYLADKQSNFHPESYWILSAIDGETNNFNQDESGYNKRYKELSVKWIGREAVIMWLLTNQIIFEVVSHKLLDEELEALGQSELNDDSAPEQILLN